MSSTEATAVDLYLVGAGVNFPAHLTIQTIDALTASKCIYTNLEPSDYASLPKDLRSKCKSLWTLYRENRHRQKNYDAVAKAVIVGATSARPVAWMTPGHPLIFDSVSQALLKAGRSRGWQVAVIPGISSIDTVLAEVGYDPAGGLLVHEATSFVRRKLKVQTEVATLFLQPSAFGSDVPHYTDDWRPDLEPFRDYLLKFYKPEHSCAFVRSPEDEDSRGRVHWLSLGGIQTVPSSALKGSTLFIPPVSRRG